MADMRLSEHYYAVLADLHQQRDRLDQIIDWVEKMADRVAHHEMQQAPMPAQPQSAVHNEKV
jgi:hypothetical protein